MWLVLKLVHAIAVPGIAGPKFTIFFHPELSSSSHCQQWKLQLYAAHVGIPTVPAELLNSVIRHLTVNSQSQICSFEEARRKLRVRSHMNLHLIHCTLVPSFGMIESCLLKHILICHVVKANLERY